MLQDEALFSLPGIQRSMLYFILAELYSDETDGFGPMLQDPSVFALPGEPIFMLTSAHSLIATSDDCDIAPHPVTEDMLRDAALFSLPGIQKLFYRIFC
jgi:hypothetical protein